MFVIACKYNPKFPFIIHLVESIRKFHPTEKIVVVDSDSDDKSYFSQIEKSLELIYKCI
jgi:glycosyltransferase involved in cell wall biosynthesis